MITLHIFPFPFLQGDSSQAYSRLDTGNTSKPKPSMSKRTSMWLLNKAVPSISNHNLTKSISKLNRKVDKEEMEKEWLLLGEASSPVNVSSPDPLNAESSILNEDTSSDTECIVKLQNSDSETSDEDIDSIVEEFQQKVKVSTSGLKETNLKLPSMGSWRVSMLCMFSVCGSCVGAAISASYELTLPFAIAVAGKFIKDFHLKFIPILDGLSSCSCDEFWYDMDPSIHIHACHTSNFYMHCVLTLQLDCFVINDVCQLDGDHILVHFRNRSCRSVDNKMWHLVLLMFGLSKSFFPHDSFVRRKSHSKHRNYNEISNSDNSLEKSSYWIIGYQPCPVEKMTYWQLGLRDRRVRRRNSWRVDWMR